ncbi:MAG: hypothetical protein K5923_03170 [Clostridia bacterium]|nr:hypothetical protein [Clostridia bacterium]
MKNYYLCDIHFHTNDSFDAWENANKSLFSQENVEATLLGDLEDSPENKVKLVCFTDHNTFVYEHYLKNYNYLKELGVLCLPGIEINTTKKVHWVFIFDNHSLSKQKNGKALGKILEEKVFEFYNYDISKPLIKQYREAQNTPVDVGKFLEIINEMEIDFIAIPHFVKDKGYYEVLKNDSTEFEKLHRFILDNIVVALESEQMKEALRNKMIQTQNYIELHMQELVAGEALDSPEEINNKMNNVEREKRFFETLKNMNSVVGNTSMIYGSDCHGNIAEYDKKKLFLMKSDLSFNGLKFALLDYDSRILPARDFSRYSKDSNYVIDKIIIDENGKQKEIEFGDGLNCIIGSRGSGKSYLLHMLLGNAKDYSTISKSISLKSIQLCKGRKVDCLTPEMFDFISQKSAANKDSINEKNIYDLLARAPYDREEFNKQLNVLDSNPQIDDTISPFIISCNSLIDLFMKINEIKKSSCDFNLIEDYDNYYKETGDDDSILNIFDRQRQYIDSKIRNDDEILRLLKEYESSYKKHTKDIENLLNIQEIKEMISDTKDKYIELGNSMYQILIDSYKEKIANRKDAYSKIFKKCDTIYYALKQKSSNTSRSLNSFTDNISSFIHKLSVVYRNIREKYKELSSYNYSDLVAHNKYTFKQGNNCLIVESIKHLNIKSIKDENILYSLLNNYNSTINNEDAIFKAFLSKDYGDYYLATFFPHRDKRKSSWGLCVPELETENYLTANNDKRKNWLELSPGQRSDILLNIVLLNESNKILIIDQPEDDLDNQTVYSKIVARIRDLKLKRQIIVVTHNANIAITADCDYLIICEQSSTVNGKYSIVNDTMESKNKHYYESISSESNDNKHTALEIAAEILDGGKEALSKRVKKIGYKSLFME